MVLGLTGRYCAGKSTAAVYLQESGWYRIDVDVIGHEVLNDMAAQIAERFGREMQRPDGSIDRGKLGKMVFTCPEDLRALENMLHPAMVRVVENRIVDADHPHTCIDAALLFQMGLDALCDRVLFITAPTWLRFLRARCRDGIRLQDFLRRNRSQTHIAAQAAQHQADIYSVSNWGWRTGLYRNIESVVTPSP